MAAEQVATFERVGLVLSLVVFALGVAELTDAIDVLPVSAHIVVLWVVALSLWLFRRRYS